MKFPTWTAALLSLGLALPAAADIGLQAGATASTAGSAAGSSGNVTSTAGGQDERNAGDETNAGKGAKAGAQAKGTSDSKAKQLRQMEEHTDDVVDSAASTPGSTADTLGVDARASGRAKTNDRSRDRH